MAERLSSDAQQKLAGLALITVAAMFWRYPDWLHQLVAGGYNSDFKSLWFAGQAALHGTPVYDVEALTDLAKAWYPDAHYINFVYPPFVLFLAVPLALLPINVAFVLWNAASLGLFYLAARPYAPRLLILTPATLVCLCFGQYGLLMGALWLWAFRLHPWALALLSGKPHIGFLAGLAFLRDLRGLAIASAIVAGLVLSSGLAFGADAWPAFFGSAFGTHADMIETDAFPTWVLQAVTPMIGFGLIGSLLYGGAAAMLLWRNFNVWTAATATFLISPYGFHYDLTVVCLGFGLMLVRQELRAYQQLICLLAFLSPFIVGIGTWLVPPVLLLGLWVQTREMSSARAPDHRGKLGVA